MNLPTIAAQWLIMGIGILGPSSRNHLSLRESYQTNSVESKIPLGPAPPKIQSLPSAKATEAAYARLCFIWKKRKRVRAERSEVFLVLSYLDHHFKHLGDVGLVGVALSHLRARAPLRISRCSYTFYVAVA